MAYEVALNNLTSQSTNLAAPQVVSALIARDVVAQALVDHRPITPEALNRITELDQQLKGVAPTIEAVVGRSMLVNWREAAQPPAGVWWWSLDERAATAEPKPGLFWGILAGFFITVSLSLTAEISRRFLSVGADFISILSTLLQGLLALLAGSAFTQTGREWIERLLSRQGIQRKFQHKWKAGLALIALLIVLALRLSLPAIARRYNDQGVREQRIGRLTSAIASYQRAISLNPDYAQAHYNLAAAYEDVLEYDKALGEYQTALRADPQSYLTYNNLARLNILHRNDYTSALTILNTALELKPNLDLSQQTLVRYSLLKNRGWANFGLSYLELAEADLRQALALRPDGAAAHCLLAQIIEAQGNHPAALVEWEACLRYEKGEFVEANWLGLARERLSQGGPK